MANILAKPSAQAAGQPRPVPKTPTAAQLVEAAKSLASFAGFPADVAAPVVKVVNAPEVAVESKSETSTKKLKSPTRPKASGSRLPTKQHCTIQAGINKEVPSDTQVKFRLVKTNTKMFHNSRPRNGV
jgi:hypothetical protein